MAWIFAVRSPNSGKLNAGKCAADLCPRRRMNSGEVPKALMHPGSGGVRITPKRCSMRAVLLALPFLAACTGTPSFTDPGLSDRELELEQFFDGNFRAYGQFQDIFGTVRRQFTVNIKGDWDGARLRLVEDFVYEDGSTEQRIWTLVKTGDETWQGTAPGVIGVAVGEERGDRFNWRYTIDLPVPSADGTTSTTRVAFNDWIWLVNDTRAFNRAYMAKAGVTIGDVSIWFEKL